MYIHSDTKYSDLFRGRPEEEFKIFCHMTKPATQKTKSILYNDGVAARTIAECQKAIEVLTEYRMALAARYAELETLPYQLELKLKREKRYGGNVYYYITITKVFADGTEAAELEETYSGTQRHEAIKRFHQLKKERPGISAEIDIAKGRWER